MLLKRILITPYFGDFPEWMDKFQPPEGYDWLLDTNIESFKKRVKYKLGIDYPDSYGSGKVWDYRCALGLLYEDEIKGFDFWGTQDFDVVWGNMDKFYPDSMISEYDLISGHDKYVCGCFSLYRNCKQVNELFKTFNLWEEKMIYENPTGWVEQEYSWMLEQSGLRYAYTFNQGWPWTPQPILKKEGNRLSQEINGEWTEIAFFHFRHSKRWPL